MLVIHNGIDMWLDDAGNTKQFKPGSTIKVPNGNFVGPISAGLDVGDGWVTAEVLAADVIPDGYEGTQVTTEMVGGVPKQVHTLQQITPEVSLARRAAQVQTTCRTKILEVADELTQMNLSASYAANRMIPADETTYLAGLDWKDAMVAHCRALVVDPNLAENWPVPSAEIIALAKKY